MTRIPSEPRIRITPNSIEGLKNAPPGEYVLVIPPFQKIPGEISITTISPEALNEYRTYWDDLPSLKDKLVACLLGPLWHGKITSTALNTRITVIPTPPVHKQFAEFYISANGGLRYCYGESPSINRSISSGATSFLLSQKVNCISQGLALNTKQQAPNTGTPNLNPINYMYKCSCIVEAYSLTNGSRTLTPERRCELHGSRLVGPTANAPRT